MTTIAGGVGISGSTNGIGTAARFNQPQALFFDGTNMYIVDRANHSIRKMILATGVVTTIAGTSGTPGFADGTGAVARFNIPQGIATDGTSFYITDSLNHRLRKIQ